MADYSHTELWEFTGCSHWCSQWWEPWKKGSLDHCFRDRDKKGKQLPRDTHQPNDRGGCDLRALLSCPGFSGFLPSCPLRMTAVLSAVVKSINKQQSSAFWALLCHSRVLISSKKKGHILDKIPQSTGATKRLLRNTERMKWVFKKYLYIHL